MYCRLPQLEIVSRRLARKANSSVECSLLNLLRKHIESFDFPVIFRLGFVSLKINVGTQRGLFIFRLVRLLF